MSGNKLLLDTNAVLSILGSEKVFSSLERRTFSVLSNECWASNPESLSFTLCLLARRSPEIRDEGGLPNAFFIPQPAFRNISPPRSQRTQRIYFIIFVS